MSTRTSHFTQRQRDALLCEANCKRQARLVELHWKKSAPYFARMLNQKLYEELDFPNFSSWADSISVSSSHAYALAQLSGLPESIQESLEEKNVTLGKIKLILPKLEEALQNQDNEGVDELVDSASRMPWHDLRESVVGDSPVPRYVFNSIDCPTCQSVIELRLSRAVEIVVNKATRKRGKHG